MIFNLFLAMPCGWNAQLKNLARSRGIGVNKMIEDLSVRAIAVWDTENHFRAMAAKGGIPQAIAILDHLDASLGLALER